MGLGGGEEEDSEEEDESVCASSLQVAIGGAKAARHGGFASLLRSLGGEH